MMTMTTAQASKKPIEKRVAVLPSQVKLNAETSKYHAVNVANLNKAEKAEEKNAAILKELFAFGVEADTPELASDKLTQKAKTLFKPKADKPEKPVTEKRKVVRTKKKTDEVAPEAANPEDKPKATRSTKKPEVKKAATVDKTAPKADKPLATFENYLDSIKVTPVKLTAEKQKIADNALKYFEAFHLDGHDHPISEADKKMITDARSVENKAVDSLFASSTIRLLITETDKKNKLVQQLLLKPLYLSPYAILSVIEATHRVDKTKSIYDAIITVPANNSGQDIRPTYECFQFNPLIPFLANTLSDEDDIKFAEKLGNKISYQFVSLK